MLMLFKSSVLSKAENTILSGYSGQDSTFVDFNTSKKSVFFFFCALKVSTTSSKEKIIIIIKRTYLKEKKPQRLFKRIRTNICVGTVLSPITPRQEYRGQV